MSVVEEAALEERLNDATAAARDECEGLVPPLAGSYAEVIRDAGRRTARLFRQKASVLTAAAFVPPAEDEVAATESTKEDMKAKARQAQDDAAAAIAAVFGEEGISFEVGAIFTQEMLDAIGERAAFAADEEIRSQYRAVIAQAAEDGWSVNRTAETIVDAIDGVSDFRAEALARTDLNGLANGASVHLATVTSDPDEPLYKRWLATNDERTRDTHAEAHGESVLVQESFPVGLSLLSYPGDPFGPPEEVMNCRCTVIYSSTPSGVVVAASAGLPLAVLARALPTVELQAIRARHARSAAPMTGIRPLTRLWCGP